MTESPCDMCKGSGKNLFKENCPYCNGTGEWNQAAEDYLRNHICQCECLDRKWCPVCHKICHHDTTNSPPQFLVPGYGGESASIQLDVTSSQLTTEPIQEEEEIIA